MPREISHIDYLGATRAGRRGRNVTVLNREIGRRPTALNGSFESPKTDRTSNKNLGVAPGFFERGRAALHITRRVWARCELKSGKRYISVSIITL